MSSNNSSDKSSEKIRKSSGANKSSKKNVTESSKKNIEEPSDKFILPLVVDETNIQQIDSLLNYLIPTDN